MAPAASGTAHVTALLYATRKDIQWEKMAIIYHSLLTDKTYELSQTWTCEEAATVRQASPHLCALPHYQYTHRLYLFPRMSWKISAIRFLRKPEFSLWWPFANNSISSCLNFSALWWEGVWCCDLLPPGLEGTMDCFLCAVSRYLCVLSHFIMPASLGCHENWECPSPCGWHIISTDKCSFSSLDSEFLHFCEVSVITSNQQIWKHV